MASWVNFYPTFKEELILHKFYQKIRGKLTLPSSSYEANITDTKTNKDIMRKGTIAKYPS